MPPATTAGAPARAGSAFAPVSPRFEVRPGKANASPKGVAAAGEIRVDAADGSLVKGRLKGAGLDPASVTISGPDGPAAVAAEGRPGSAKFGPVVLDTGTGRYRIAFTATGPATYSVIPKRPEASGVVTDQDPP